MTLRARDTAWFMAGGAFWLGLVLLLVWGIKLGG